MLLGLEPTDVDLLVSLKMKERPRRVLPDEDASGLTVESVLISPDFKQSDGLHSLLLCSVC